MSEDTLLPFDLPSVARKKLSVGFDGGQLSSDAGVLLLRGVEKKLGLAARLSSCIRDRRNPERILGNVGGSPTPGNHTAETRLAGRGARIRTWEWRNRLKWYVRVAWPTKRHAGLKGKPRRGCPSKAMPTPFHLAVWPPHLSSAIAHYHRN